MYFMLTYLQNNGTKGLMEGIVDSFSLKAF